LPGLGTRAGEALVIVVDTDGNRREESFAPVNQCELMVDAFCEAINETEPLLTPASSLNNMKALDALFRSAKSGSFANA
jgi:D-xylose 1-dehydrogenase (NADP+, D-xylono-1,5-lactone-forming)